MEQIRIYSRKWLHNVLGNATDVNLSAEERLNTLIEDITDYLDYLEELDYKRVSSRSERKSESSRKNGRKGGRPRKKYEIQE